MLNAIWLETFTTLCEVGHFTRTAERMGMTQPGVSQHLRKLEAQVGKPLILKDGKSFTLTPAGEAVFELGKSRRAEERALRDAISADDPKVGELRIGCSGSFAMWVYPHLLKAMQDAPELVIQVTAAPQASIISQVLEGAFDLGVVSDKPDHPRLEATPLAREELCLVLPATYEGDGIDLARLNALGFVGHPDGYAYANELFALNFSQEYLGSDRLRLRTFVNQIGQIPLPVAQGLGYTILPRSGIDPFPHQDALKILPLPKRRYHRLWSISRRGRSGFARIAAVEALMKHTAQALGTP
ncbi:LysR family transcriptional regulator [Celeribacter halophilus]|uniref:DNA-binding transcriptional regulator, LysR family n=1 Tax=Celeribacter halophilus TaxID=576117 RepID=A0A1I3QXY1_9RHOB|nr:LysR family transcriptional regulator [Celeribacter halophilus]PZX13264.1 DNA-binding transcriptional LysR family regulator [Celeribacter halophilus]SFJ38141.1 DNA-binding transcriptional regulator, LysR family [Celeribacter halophilus]